MVSGVIKNCPRPQGSMIYSDVNQLCKITEIDFDTKRFLKPPGYYLFLGWSAQRT